MLIVRNMKAKVTVKRTLTSQVRFQRGPTKMARYSAKLLQGPSTTEAGQRQ